MRARPDEAMVVVRTENEVRIYGELHLKLPTPARTPAEARVIRERMAIALAMLKGA